MKELPESWDAFRAMCYKVREWAKSQENEIKPLQTSPEGYLYFIDHMLLENGAGNSGDWNTKAQTSLNDLKEIYAYSTSENAEYSYLDETRLFNEGKLAVYVNGVWVPP